MSGVVDGMLRSPLGQYLRRALWSLQLKGLSTPLLTTLVAAALAYFLLRRRAAPAEPPASLGGGGGAAGGAAAGAGGGGARPSSTKLANVQGVRVASLNTAGCLLSRAGGRVSMVGGALPAVLELARTTNLFLLSLVASDEEQAQVERALRDAGLVVGGGRSGGAGGGRGAKMLFCSMESGIASFVRQLECDLHIDCSADVISALHPVARSRDGKTPTRLAHISATRSATLPMSVHSALSLGTYFGV